MAEAYRSDMAEQSHEHAERTLTRNTLLVSVTLTKPGNSKAVKVDGDAVKIQVRDTTRVSVAKKLIAKKYFQAILDLDRNTRAYMRAMQLPSNYKSGMYLISNSLIPEVHAFLEAQKVRRKELAAQFVEAWPEAIQDAIGQRGEDGELGALGDPHDYESATQIGQLFDFETRYISLDTPRVLQEISQSIFKQELANMKSECVAASQQIMSGLREGFATLVQRVAHGLTSNEDGKKRRLHESTVEELRTFLRVFEDQNIFNDADLARYVAQAQQLIDGKDVDTLRTDDEVRGAILSGFEAIATGLEQNLQVVAKRKYSFETEQQPMPVDVASERGAEVADHDGNA